jgi:Spy/CpxP family protein refolding chaperone
MGVLKRQLAVLSAGVAVACFALVAGAQTPPPAGGEARQDKREIRQDKKELREDKKELREDRKEAREEAREDRKEAREEAREDRKEAREDRRENIEELRQTRAERRKERLKKWREKWGNDLANRPNVKAEVKVHARRMARLNHMRRVAVGANKTELVARIDKLIEREQARHTAALERLKAEGAK